LKKLLDGEIGEIKVKRTGKIDGGFKFYLKILF
jgi:hypothetical protein